MENLRYLLMGYDKNKSLYIGCRFKPFSKSGFMSGGAGYILTKSSIDLFVKSVDPLYPEGLPTSK